MTRVALPRAVYEGIVAVRDSGRTNMFDWPAVAAIALELGHPKAAAWIRENKGSYARGVLQGIGPEPDPVADALAQIAREELGIETLEVRGRDRLDFHDVGVAGLRRALKRAFEMGRGAQA